MLKNQENFIIVFFVVILFLVGIYVFLSKKIVDAIYFGGILYYFFRFLKIRKFGR